MKFGQNLWRMLPSGVPQLREQLARRPWRLEVEHRQALEVRLGMSTAQLLPFLSSRLGDGDVAVGLAKSGRTFLGPALELGDRKLEATQTLVAQMFVAGEVLEAFSCSTPPVGASRQLLRQLWNFQELRWFGGLS
ncbi:Uncharacterized protein SCF082_LOCUS31570 [Durusdinium trenchii]|uniref:Selenoprotein O n=2 Tax=Durusdinium trenchii TaxID=1381693 RepID=A0ABP0N159_9DINO|eukprot:g20390.t1